MDLLIKLFTPLNYLRIQHDQKRWLDFFMPAILSLCVCAIYVLLPVRLDLTGDKGLIATLGTYLQVLSGFYIAALAAIATFPNKNMDVEMDGVPVALNNHNLTRRQFLSYLFGYLAFIGFGLVMVGSLVQLLAPSIEFYSKCMPDGFKWLKLAGLFFYLVCFFSIILTTLLGLYYLTDKIHENKPVFSNSSNVEPKDDEPDDF